MSKTQYFTATTIDGYIADPDNSLAWLFEAEDDVNRSPFPTFFADVGAFAMGATTYEWVLDHDDLLNNPGKWREGYGSVPCWIFTHRDLPPIPGAPLTFVSGDVRPVHDAMTAAAGDKNVWIVGGGELAGRFADEGLLDELILGVAPATLGAGAPLLPRRLTASRLSLTDVERRDQFAYLTYALGSPS